ncbi:monovalent cation/H+ antiporter complex subunit F [Mycolicibacterium elephantis]
MSYVWTITGALISAAALVTMYRMLAGPSTLDRLVALDTLTAVTMCGIGTWAAFSQDSTVTYPMAAIALISFVGTISVARFRVRDVERPRGGRGTR